MSRFGFGGGGRYRGGMVGISGFGSMVRRDTGRQEWAGGLRYGAGGKATIAGGYSWQVANHSLGVAIRSRLRLEQPQWP